ncbi:MAG: hypothetical protein LBC95_03375 [Candidatus Nomurabacteria bacterium]|jgi:hypothetical protein|nr:hypothetical protein [Candidatus Nomurabacteria bacterium]
MSKNRKKRNKKYSGWDARVDDSTVTVHKVSAVNRPPARQWLHEHRRLVKTVGIAVLVGGGVTTLIVLGISSL